MSFFWLTDNPNFDIISKITKEYKIMFEKNKDNESYIRDSFTFEEELFKLYIEMRQAVNRVEKMKYSGADDIIISNEDFKQGFLAGVKIMSSLLFDI